MATFADTAVPRKRIMTYGKAVRKRVSDYSFESPAPKSQAAETKEYEFVDSRSPSITPLESEKSENISGRYASRTPLSPSPVSANVFDVPSSDDEKDLPTPKPVLKKAVNKAKGINTKKVLSVAAEDGERRKNMKLSPARQSIQKPHTVKTTTKQPTPNATIQSPEQLRKLLGIGQNGTMVARPIPTAVRRSPDRPSTPQQLSSTPKIMTPSTPSGAMSDCDAMDIDPPASFMSPRGLQIWKDLLEPLDDSEIDETLLELETKADQSKAGPSEILLPHRKLSRPAGISKNARKASEKLPRRRLIDSLVEQTIQDEKDEHRPSSADSDIVSSHPLPPLHPNTIDNPRSQSLAPGTSGLPAPLSSQGSQSTGPKFTYSRQRSMLSEKDIMQELALDIPSQSVQPPSNARNQRGSASALPPLQSFPEEQDDVEGISGIRSVHELRQAGANNRFLDEVEDLLDRIGTPSTSPSSMRRAGLLDLASKMRDKDFERKFRANGVEQRLFIDLGQETDLIAGFFMVSILIALLVDTGMPHVVAQLRRHGITRLLTRLLEWQTGIIPLSKEHKWNMSKFTRSSISELQEFLLGLPIWEDLQPRAITPRTTGLKCLELMIRQTREAGNSGDVISQELTTALFSILKTAEDESAWQLPDGQQAIDFCLSLSALESHSITARTAYDESIWISDFLPIVADTLEIALSRPVEGFGLLQVLILRLTLNVTNNKPKATDVFAREALMSIMGQAIVTKFKMISRFLTEAEFSITMDHLILVLGVMINFAEWSSLARRSLQGLDGKANDPLGDMTQLFLDNQARTSEVGVSFPYVRSKTNTIRRNPLKRARRMLLLAIFLFSWAISHYSLILRSGFGYDSHERIFDPC
jgi:hypothetical protein